VAYECKILNHGRTVEIGGMWYDFPDALTAEAFVHAVETGSVPHQTYALLLDREYFPRPADH